MRVLDEKGIRVYHAFAGNYMTSIDMQGASVTFLKLDDELKGLLDAPSDAPAFRVSGGELPARFYPVAASGAKAAAGGHDLGMGVARRPGRPADA